MDISDVEENKQHLEKQNPNNLLVNQHLFGLFRGYGYNYRLYMGRALRANKHLEKSTLELPISYWHTTNESTCTPCALKLPRMGEIWGKAH